MNRAADNIGIERGHEEREKIPKERLVNPATGRVEDLPASVAESAARRRGLKPKINWGRPTPREKLPPYDPNAKVRWLRERDPEHDPA